MNPTDESSCCICIRGAPHAHMYIMNLAHAFTPALAASPALHHSAANACSMQSRLMLWHGAWSRRNHLLVLPRSHQCEFCFLNPGTGFAAVSHFYGNGTLIPWAIPVAAVSTIQTIVSVLESCSQKHSEFSLCCLMCGCGNWWKLYHEFEKYVAWVAITRLKLVADQGFQKTKMFRNLCLKDRTM